METKLERFPLLPFSLFCGAASLNELPQPSSAFGQATSGVNPSLHHSLVVHAEVQDLWLLCEAEAQGLSAATRSVTEGHVCRLCCKRQMFVVCV